MVAFLGPWDMVDVGLWAVFPNFRNEVLPNRSGLGSAYGPAQYLIVQFEDCFPKFYFYGLWNTGSDCLLGRTGPWSNRALIVNYWEPDKTWTGDSSFRKNCWIFSVNDSRIFSARVQLYQSRPKPAWIPNCFDLVPLWTCFHCNGKTKSGDGPEIPRSGQENLDPGPPEGPKFTILP